MPEKKRFIVTMPPEMHKWLAERAKENGRSANAEAVQLFKEEMKKDQEEK